MTTDALTDREKRQQRKYNVTPEAYERQLDAQHNRCPICHRPFSSTRLPCIEHDHETGLWRGITCSYCNDEIGHHHDNAGWFRACADYLDHPPAAHEQVYAPGSPGAEGVL